MQQITGVTTTINITYMTHRQQRVGIEQKTTTKQDFAGEFFLRKSLDSIKSAA